MSKVVIVEPTGSALSVTREGYGHDHNTRTYEGKVLATGKGVRIPVAVGDSVVYRASEVEVVTVQYSTSYIIDEDAVVGIVRVSETA